ncbi:lysophospholipid acyltransferase family protein [Macromonas bipunctata]|uniref:lysophospholipid acyltransferase family protein n=1 Tax=Macromonas bipunctata TaxID=183670 RepID=UPI001F0C6577|nr:lipid A biosynthesis acyltransferase [Macromonas bipunctata]
MAAWHEALQRAWLHGLMGLMARLPLRWVRGLGWALGQVLYCVVPQRRRVALANWAACFPELPQVQRQRAVRRHFVYFAQAWLDRGWLWGADAATVRQRLQLVGDVAALQGDTPSVLFAPHFVGMDAGWTALTAHLPRRFCGIYAHQDNVVVDRWMEHGRQRFGQPHIVAKREGLKPLVSALRAGEPLYVLPDMDHGLGDSVFAPFFGVPAATLTSLPRFAKLGRAQVVPVTARLTAAGYEVRIWPAWADYPTGDLLADVTLSNQRLEAMIRTMPEQYYWVHKRFKTRPPGQPSLYPRR